MMNNTLFSTRPIKLPPWLKGWKGFWAIGIGVYLIIYVLWILFKWTDPAYESFIISFGYLPPGIFAVICAIYTANQKQLELHVRRAWQVIALGIISLVMADIIYESLSLRGEIRFPNLSDFFYLAFYPLAFWGLVIIPKPFSDPIQRRTWRLDIAMTVTGIAAIFWYFIIVPTAIAAGEDWVSRLVAGAYPSMSVLILAGIVSIPFRQNEINTRHALYLLGTGMLIYALADIILTWLVLHDLYVSGSPIDALWLLSYLLIGLAALRQATPYRIEPESKKTMPLWQTLILPFLAAGANAILLLYAINARNNTVLQTYGLAIGIIISMFIMMARYIITSRENARLVDVLSRSTEQLRISAEQLEERVRERTRELENQTEKLRLAAQIAQETAAAKDLNDLLNRSTKLIIERFNLHHAGIFLLDDKGEYAVLIASPTKVGQEAIAREYKVHVAEPDIVARVIKSRQPELQRHLTSTENRHASFIVPNTQSELVLPLMVEEKIIGVLDIHSENAEAFNQDDIAIMQILADQLATSIERTQLLQQVQQRAAELEIAYGRTTRERWRAFLFSGILGHTGYRFDNIRIQPISDIPAPGDKALRSGSTIIQENGMVAIPIKLRGQTIGAVTVKLKEGYNQRTISTLEQAIERLAASLESARLYEEARLRADREQTISLLTSAITSSTEYDEILRTTIREIGTILGETEVAIQILENPNGHQTE
ncbi:MAG TPA: GAF domain-containing protein [Anaerolineales bacterium]|nr:GAF domain-containing protein [Anaerolineales bacterium]